MKKLLIINHEEKQFDFIRENLQVKDVIIKKAKGTRDGVVKARKFSPDLILYSVPENPKSILEFFVALISHDELKNISVIFLLDKADAKRLSRTSNANHFYFKSKVRPKVLLSILKDLLEGKPIKWIV